MPITDSFKTFTQSYSDQFPFFAFETFSNRMHILSNALDIFLNPNAKSPPSVRCSHINAYLEFTVAYIKAFSEEVNKYPKVQFYQTPLATFTKELIQEIQKFTEGPAIKNLPEKNQLETTLKNLQATLPDSEHPSQRM